jgi:hypothetical protein
MTSRRRIVVSAFTLPMFTLLLAGCPGEVDIDGPVADCNDPDSIFYPCEEEIDPDYIDPCLGDDPPGPPECPDAPPPPDDPDDPNIPPGQYLAYGESCYNCHANNDYNTPTAIEHPHPWQDLRCTHCHAGRPDRAGIEAHIPPPPGLSYNQIQNDFGTPTGFWAEFNRRSLTGIDKIGEYTVNGETFTGLEWLQFINPGDLRVVTQGQSCGSAGCHVEQVEKVSRSVIATNVGLWSTARFAVGIANEYPDRAQLDRNTLADVGPRAVSNPGYTAGDRKIGEVPSLRENTEYAGQNMRDNYTDYTANAVANSRYDGANEGQPDLDGRAQGFVTRQLLSTTFTIQCGDCHLYSAGQNDRYADFRSSGCTSCHFEYAADGVSRSRGYQRLWRQGEGPQDPDAIAPGERSHPRDHRIRNVAKEVNGAYIRGIADRSCVACHQGSNRTVLQYWGYRIDPEEYLANDVPNPFVAENVTFAIDGPPPGSIAPPLYDPQVNNQTYHGLNLATQIIALEDYDGDGLDDSPPDIHHRRGLGCIDCHGSNEMHGDGRIYSRMSQQVAITCENCHGTVDRNARTDEGGYAVDSWGRRVTNVQRDAAGEFWLRSRVTGRLHYLPQLRDVIYNNNKNNPSTQQQVYNELASFAKGRYDNDNRTGRGPIQQNLQIRQGFSHTGDATADGYYTRGGMTCASCHAGWQNNCVGCHLDLEYDQNLVDQFSNITGERIYTALDATFRYTNPVSQFLGVTSHGKIGWFQPEMKMFFSFVDYNNDNSVDEFDGKLTYSDRLGYGSNTAHQLRGNNQALGFNQFSPHSIQGRMRNFDNKDANNPLRFAGLGAVKDCVSCHLVDGEDQLGNAVDTVNDADAVLWVRKVLGIDDGGYYDFDRFGEPIFNGIGDPNDIAYRTGIVVDENTGAVYSGSTVPLAASANGGVPSPVTGMTGPLTLEYILRQLDPNRTLDTVYMRRQ